MQELEGRGEGVVATGGQEAKARVPSLNMFSGMFFVVSVFVLRGYLLGFGRHSWHHVTHPILGVLSRHDFNACQTPNARH